MEKDLLTILHSVVVTGESVTPSLEFASASLNHLTSKEELDREKHGRILIVTVSVL